MNKKCEGCGCVYNFNLAQNRHPKYCRTCRRDLGLLDEIKERVSLEERKRIQLNSQLFQIYGITIEEFDRMYSQQNGCCKICKIHSSKFRRRLCVDHCHTTGKVRGLLCDGCNHLISRAKNSVGLLQSAIDYLK